VMWWWMTHPSRDLAPYADGQLPPGKRRAVEAHLAACARCRAELDDIQFAAGLVRQVAIVTAPASVWTSIEHAIDGSKGRTSSSHAALSTTSHPSLFEMPALRWAVASLVMLVAVGGAAYWYTGRSPSNDRPRVEGIGTASWEVTRLDAGGGTARMAAGEWVETGGASRARITVGDIGTVDVEPGTRVRLGDVLPAEYRIELARGTISARINAPPRFFIVDTPTSTVVDLGCAYTMQVEDDGTGVLRMTEGWASLEWKGRESLVPAGAHCRTRRGVGPGTPYFADAPAPLQEALAGFDFADGGAAAVKTVLAHSRVRDTLTLWHLLSRVDAGERARVFDRIAALTPPPAGLSREKALQLDAETLKTWREELAWTW
jgi:hypothetical protein